MKKRIYGGLALGIAFILVVMYLSHIKGWDENHVSDEDKELMKECVEAAEPMVPEGTDVTAIATMLYKDTKRTTAFW